MIPATTSLLNPRSALRAPRFTVDRVYDVICNKAASNSAGIILSITSDNIVRYTNYTSYERVGNQSQIGTSTLSNITYGAGMWAVCGTNNLLLVSTNDGTDWANVTAPASFTSICIDSSGAIVGVAVNQVWKLATLSSSWVQTSTSIGTSIGIKMGYDTYRNIYLASQGSGSVFNLYKSTDAVTWTVVNTTASITEISFAWNSAATVYTYTTGTTPTIRQSADWTAGTVRVTLAASTSMLGAGASSSGFVVSAQYGYYHSADGVTWSTKSRTSTTGNGYGSYMFPLLSTTNTTIEGFSNGTNTIMTSADGGLSWSASTSGTAPFGAPFTSSVTPAFSLDESTGTVLIWGTGTSTNGPAWSTDGGVLETFTSIGQSTTVVSNAMSFLGTNHVWVFTTNDLNTTTYRSYRSTDHGNTWTAWLTTGNTTYAPQTMVSNGTTTVIGMYGSIYSTSDGVTWTARTSGFAVNNKPIIATDGTSFVAINRAVATETSKSSDGITWTKTTQTAMPNTAIVWSGQYFIAVGTAGAIKTSTDGVTWTARTSGTTKAITTIAANPATGVVLATVSYTGALTDQADSILRSADGGATWSFVSLGRNVGFTQGVYWTGSQFICVAAGSVPHLWLTSPDGATWSVKPQRTPITTAGFKSMVNGLGDDSALYSVTQSATSSFIFNQINGRTTGTPSVTQISALGNTLSSVPTSGGAIFITHNGKYYCAFPATSQFTTIYSSTDVKTWSMIASGASGGNLATWQFSGGTMGTSAPVTLASVAGNLLLGVTSTSANGCGIFRSTDDGVTWSRVYPSSVATICVTSDGIAWAFPAVGGLQYSADGGATWTQAATTTIVPLQSVGVYYALNVVYSGQGYILTLQGKVYSSTDKTTWTNRTYTGSISVSGCVATNNAVVVLGANGAALAYTYDNGATWTFTTNTVASLSGPNTIWDGQSLYLGSTSILYAVDV